MSNMMIDAQQTDGGDVVLSLAGDVDLSHVDALWSAATEALDRTPRRVVLDVSAVTFLDSAILGVLIRIHHAAEAQRKEFALRRPSRIVDRLLRITGLQKLIAVER